MLRVVGGTISRSIAALLEAGARPEIYVAATHGLLLLGPTRCMFASHMPIAALSRPIQDVYRTYGEIVEGFTSSERRRLFHDTARSNYRV